MYRRGRTAAATAVVRGRLPLLVPPGSVVVVVALDGNAVLEEGERATLGQYDAAVLHRSPGVLRTDGHAAVVTLRGRA